MKYLLLVRHAKSSWDSTVISDIDRPLNERGKKDAPMMAQRIAKKNVPVDLLLSSSAKRARKTAQLFAETLGMDPSGIRLDPELYLAGPENFFEILGQQPDSLKCIALFSHNPGISAFAQQLVSDGPQHMPTCAVLGVKIHCQHWKDLRRSKSETWFFDYPKMDD